MEYSYVFFVSRRWNWKRFSKIINSLELDPDAEMIIHLDAKDKEFLDKVLCFLDTQRNKVREARVVYSNKEPLHEYSNVTKRRERIIENFNRVKEYIRDSKKVFSLEDDSLPPKDILSRLERLWDEKTGIVSGVQAGRWGLNMIGAYKITENEVRTVQLKNKGFEEVDACGWYCYLTLTELVKKITPETRGECFGPDVVFSYEVKKLGYKVKIDWTSQVIHILKGKDIKPNNGYIVWQKKDKWKVAKYHEGDKI